MEKKLNLEVFKEYQEIFNQNLEVAKILNINIPKPQCVSQVEIIRNALEEGKMREEEDLQPALVKNGILVEPEDFTDYGKWIRQGEEMFKKLTIKKNSCVQDKDCSGIEAPKKLYQFLKVKDELGSAEHAGEYKSLPFKNGMSSTN